MADELILDDLVEDCADIEFEPCNYHEGWNGNVYYASVRVSIRNDDKREVDENEQRTD